MSLYDFDNKLNPKNIKDSADSLRDVQRVLQDVSSQGTKFGDGLSNQAGKTADTISNLLGLIGKLSNSKFNIDSGNLLDVSQSLKDVSATVTELSNSLQNNSSLSGINELHKALSTVPGLLDNISNSNDSLVTSSGNVTNVLRGTSEAISQGASAFSMYDREVEKFSSTTKNAQDGLAKFYGMMQGTGNAPAFDNINAQILAMSDNLQSIKVSLKSANTIKDPENVTKQVNLASESLDTIFEKLNNIMQSSAALKIPTDELDRNVEGVKKLQSSISEVSNTLITTFSDLSSKGLIEKADMFIDDLQKVSQKVNSLNAPNHAPNFSYQNQLYADRFAGNYGSDESDRRNDLIHMAIGTPAINSYQSNVEGIANQAQNINSQAWNMQNRAADLNSNMSWSQRNAYNSLDLGNIQKDAQEIIRLKAEFTEAQSNLMGAQKKAIAPNADAQDKEEAKRHFQVVQGFQSQIHAKNKSLSRHISLIDPKDKERWGQEAIQLRSYLKQLLNNEANAGNQLTLLGSQNTAINPEDLKITKDQTNAVKDLGDAYTDAEKKGKDFVSTMKSGLNELMSPLHMLTKSLGMIGIGALAGGITGFAGGAFKDYMKQGHMMAVNAQTDAYMGTDLNSSIMSNNRQRVHDLSLDYYRRSGGLIGFDEYSKSYNSAAREVGGHYGSTPNQGAQDMQDLVGKTFLMQQTYGIDQGTMNDAYKTFYKDMGQSASEAADSIARVTLSAQAANIPVAQYLKMVTGVAQQYMKIGLSGKDAENIMANLVHQGMRAEVAQSMATQTGNAINKFADNNTDVGFAAALQGKDPWEAIGNSYMSHDKNGDPIEQWSKDTASQMDTMVKLYAGIGGDNKGVSRKVLGDQFKSMGFDRRATSQLISSYESGDHDAFAKMLQKKSDQVDNPNGALEKINSTLNDQLAVIAGQLSEAEQIEKEAQASRWELATNIGPELNSILKELEPSIKNLTKMFSDSIGWLVAKIDEFMKSDIWKGALKPSLEWATASPVHAAEALGGLAFANWARKKVFSKGGTAVSHAVTESGSLLSKAGRLIRGNPKASAAVMAGVAAFGFANKAFAGKRENYEDTGEDGIFGHMAGRLDDIYGALTGDGIHVKPKTGSSTSIDHSNFDSHISPGMGIMGTAATYYGANRLLSMSGAKTSVKAAEKIAAETAEKTAAKTAEEIIIKTAANGERTTAGGIILSNANSSMETKLANNAVKTETSASMMSKVLPMLGKFGKSALGKNFIADALIETAGAGYDLYGHSQKGDLVQGDAGRVAVNAGVNLGYMGAGAALGTMIAPGPGTLIGGAIGGLVGAGVDMFGERDANGHNVNDRMRDSLTALFTGKHLSEIEEDRSNQTDLQKYGTPDKEKQLKAQLKLMGYSDEQIEAMNDEFKKNRDQLEAHGLKFDSLNKQQQAYFLAHQGHIDTNGKFVVNNTKEIQNLIKAFQNFNFREKAAEAAGKQENNIRTKVAQELDDPGTLSARLGNTEGKLRAKQEQQLEDLKNNPEDVSKLLAIKETDEQLEKLTRAQYTLDASPEQREADHKASWDELQKNPITAATNGTLEEYLARQKEIDENVVAEMKSQATESYVDERLSEEGTAETYAGTTTDATDSDAAAAAAQKAADDQAAEAEKAAQIASGNAPADASETNENEKQAKADDSRKRANEPITEQQKKSIEEQKKAEVLSKEQNKLIGQLTNQEKVLFKAMEMTANHNTKAIHTKLEEMRHLLDLIRINTANGGKGNSSYKGNAYNELKKKDPELAKWVDEASTKYGVSKDLISAVMKAESSFKRGTPKNAAGAIGLMQVTSDKGTGLDPYDDHQNVQIGAKHLRYLLDYYKGDERLALAGYNAGEGNVDDWIKQYGTRDWNTISAGLAKDHKFKETQDYVQKIMGNDNGGGAGGNDAVARAMAYAGKVKYAYGAKDIDSGQIDCTGLVSKVYEGGDAHLVGSNQYENMKKDGKLTTDQNQASPGDLVFFKTGAGESGEDGWSHIGIYAGNGQMVDAGSSTGVSKRDVSDLGDMFLAYGKVESSMLGSGVGDSQYTETNYAETAANALAQQAANQQAATQRANATANAAAATNGQAPSTDPLEQSKAAVKDSMDHRSSVFGQVVDASKINDSKAIPGSMMSVSLGEGAYYSNMSGGLMNIGDMAKDLANKMGPSSLVSYGGSAEVQSLALRQKFDGGIKSFSGITTPRVTDEMINRISDIHELKQKINDIDPHIMDSAVREDIDKNGNKTLDISLDVNADGMTAELTNRIKEAIKTAIAEYGANLKEIKENNRSDGVNQWLAIGDLKSEMRSASAGES